MREFKIFLLVFMISHYFWGQSEALTKIPFTLEGDHIFIKVKVNGSDELDFMFDTGMTNTAINLKTAERLNMTGDRTVETGGASGKFYAKLSKNNTINFNGIDLTKINMEEVSLLHLERKIGKDIDGLIGFSLLKKYIVKVNYNSMCLELFLPSKFEYHGNGEVFDMTVGKLSFINGKIIVGEQDGFFGELIVDTGAGLALALATPFANRNQIESKLGKTYEMEVVAYGEKRTKIKTGLIKEISLQNTSFKNVPIAIFNSPSGVFTSKYIAGVIGNVLLKRFNITFDYKHKKSYWEPNSIHYEDKFSLQCSGLLLALDKMKRKVEIESIIPNSSGSRSQLKVGDQILEIDGIIAKKSSLFELRELLSQDGKEVDIKYKREGIEVITKLKLKALI